MPQVLGHIVIADLVAESLGNPQHIRRNREAFHLGSVGPDMAFFLFDSTLGDNDAYKAVMDVLAIISQFVEFAEPIADVLNGPQNEMQAWITGGFSDDMQDLASLGYKAAQSAVLLQTIPGQADTIENPFYYSDVDIPGVPKSKFLTIQATEANGPAISAFRKFGHPYSHDLDHDYLSIPEIDFSTFPPGLSFGPYKLPDPDTFNDYVDWWWVDLLHYRRTGLFAQRLVENAQASGSASLLAYSQGYTTHVAGDVCGHPYINTVVGGPYRSHPLRHMVVENVIDTWIWNRYREESATASSIHRNLQLDIEPIAELIIQTMQHVYTDPDARYRLREIRPRHRNQDGGLDWAFGAGMSPVPSVENIRNAYDLMLRFLELSTSNEMERPEPPPGNPQELIEELVRRLGSPLEEMAETIADAGSIWEMILALLAAALYALVFLTQLATIIPALVVSMAVLPVRWIAYFIKMGFYNYISSVRMLLVLSGLGKPSRDDLEHHVAQIWTRLRADRTIDGRGTINDAFKYPYSPVPIEKEKGFWIDDPSKQKAKLDEFPWRPSQGLESCPYPAGSTPDIFISGPGYHVGRDADLKEGWDTPAEVRAQEELTLDGPQYGNAVEFAKRLLRGDFDGAVSFDLDGDLGYGFRSWGIDKPADLRKPPYYYRADGTRPANTPYEVD